MWVEQRHPDHSLHWRYEVDGKWYIGYISNSAQFSAKFACIVSNGKNTDVIGLGHYDHIIRETAVPQELKTDAEIMRWLEMIWLTNTWKNYVE